MGELSGLLLGSEGVDTYSQTPSLSPSNLWDFTFTYPMRWAFFIFRGMIKVMNTMNLVREHIGRVEVMQLATAVNNQPWACTVHFVYANDKLYWLSLTNTRHSQELAQNPRVAVAMAIQTTSPVIGVQMAGDAAAVTDPVEVDAVISAFSKRHSRGEDELRAALAAGNHSFYRFTPQTFVIFDKQNFPDEPRQEWSAS